MGISVNEPRYTATSVVACGWAGAIFEVTGAFGREKYAEENTVGPRLIGPIGTEDLSPLSQDNL